MASRLLEVPLRNQTLDLWCWAAVASAVSAYFQPHLTFVEPCQVAKRVINNTLDCCANPLQCDFRADLHTAFQAIGLSAASPVSPLPFAVVADLVINRRFPVGARLVGSGVGGHFVLIVGCDDATGKVIVADPSGSPGMPSGRWEMSYDDLLRNYGSWQGVCTHSVLIG